MTNLPLTPDQRVLGRENADRALGVSRRDWLKAAEWYSKDRGGRR